MTVNPNLPKSVQLLQAARGPVILITVGALFAMDQAGMLSFGRTWPLLLIVLGVMKLLERVAAPSAPYIAPPYGTAPPPYAQAPYYPPYAPPTPPSAPPPPPPGARRQ